MTSGESLPADQAVREQALNPERSFIVEAPAGSGKTELLTRRFLKLLSCVRAPEEILAITFTRKAAAEMRNRIVRALTMAAREKPESEKGRAVWELARAVRDVDARHGWQLSTHPSRLRIMTIDSLNAFLARQLPLLSGAGASLAIARDPIPLYAEAALRLVERLSERDAVGDAVARLLRHLDNRYELFSTLLTQELERREHWLDLGLMRFDLPSLRARLESTLRVAIADELAIVHAAIPTEVRRELFELVTHAAAVLNGIGAESDITACDSLKDIPSPNPDAIREWRGLAALLLTEKGTWRKKPDVRVGFPPEDQAMKARMSELLKRLERETDLAARLHAARALPNAAYSDEQWRVLTDLLEVLKQAFVELEVVMRERGEADYVANAIAARRALGSALEPTDLALRLDYRLRHILVDEFQDTSRGQIELLGLLTAGWSDGDGRTLFCVGDPMQSIYRFRNADVGLFLNLKRYGLNQLRLAPLRLSVNFRSSKPVLDWVNAAFDRVLPNRDDPERGAVAFTASEPKPGAKTNGGVFVHAVVTDRQSFRLEEARRIAALIEKTRAEQPEARIAVLVGGRKHLEYLIEELHARAIAFSAEKIDALKDRPAIQDLIALTRALVHLADRTAWLSILRAPWCGLSIADLHALCGDERAEGTVWQRLGEPNNLQVLSSDGRERIARSVAVLANALRTRGRIALRDCVERTWHALGGPATVASALALQDAAAFFDRLGEIERNGDMEDIATLEGSLTDLYAATNVEGGIDGEKVELMTIHRAKGLEFDVVILPALDRSVASDRAPLLRAQELPQLDGRSLLLAPIAARGVDTDPIYGWLALLEKERVRLERGRLLYVAATRAENELHLFGALEPETTARPNTFLNVLWPIVESHFANNRMVATTAPPVVKTERGIKTRRVPTEWAPPSPEAQDSADLLDVIENEPLQPEFEWVGETARHVGSIVHREIERWIRTGIPLDQATSFADSSRFRVALAELGVPPDLLDAAVSRVTAALISLARDERGRWLLNSNLHRDAASELAISGVIDGVIENRVIDRTFLDRDGYRWIVDFKTSTHEGGGLDAFLASEVDRYRPQLQRYARLMRGLKPHEPIKAALYFPALGAWREVGVD